MSATFDKWEGDVRTFSASNASVGKLASLEHTMSAVAGTVTTVDIPNYARTIRLFPRGSSIRFAIDEAPAAVGTDNTFGAGGIAKADAWEERTLDSGTGRVLQLRSTGTAVVVDVEVSG